MGVDRVERQRARLQILIDECGSQKALADAVGVPGNYISQLMNSRKGIARKFCVRLEKACNKPDGWMDQWLPSETTPDVAKALLAEILADRESGPPSP